MSGFVAITAFLVGTLLTLSDVYVGMENGVICHHVVMRFKEVLFFGHFMLSNLFLPLWQDYSFALTFKSVDEILWCYHSNETSLGEVL